MTAHHVVIADYGVGNLLSVERALESCGAVVSFAHTPEEIAKADRLVLPGVGAFADGMTGLRERGFDAAIVEHAQRERPLLAICLGMQMLLSSSEEFGQHEGLGIIEGVVRAIPHQSVTGERLKVPQIGWAEIHAPRGRTWSGSILEQTAAGSAVYLLHSFAAEPTDPSNVLAVYERDGQPITAAVDRGNTIGTQFHPEKSGPTGLRIIDAFVRL